MKKYRSHKIVEAAKIWQIIMSGENGALPPSIKAPVICYENPDRTVGPYVEVEESFFARGTPAIGDYLVRYDDGYLSWSPRDKFEAGYTEIE